jgi:hypothetical protein
MSVEYSTVIEDKILSHLDGWVIDSTLPNPTLTNDDTQTESDNVESNEETTTTTTTTTESSEVIVEPFITTLSNYRDNPNKRILSTEVQGFYEEALNKAYTLTNRWNVDDLTTIEEAIFIDAVCMLTASDLWNKFNIRVNNEDMEDTFIQSYGGLLYKQAMNTLHPFINQRIYTGTSIKAKQDQQRTTIDDDCRIDWW